MEKTRPSLIDSLRNPEDQNAWEKLARLYTPLLLHWARREGDNDPDDSVQELFIVLVKKMPDFRYDANRSFRAWLKTILKHIVWKKLRHPKASQLPGDVSLPDPLTDHEDAEARQYLLARALELIRTDFADKTWKSFWECVVNGRTAAEVAGELGITVGATWTNISRVRARLRTHFAGDLD